MCNDRSKSSVRCYYRQKFYTCRSYMTATPTVAPKDLADYLLAHGLPIVTLAQIRELTGLDAALARQAVARLVKAGQLFTPSRGLYGAIPPEYRTWGVRPGLEFVDAMMAAMGRDYYVSLLSAAELHGAAH